MQVGNILALDVGQARVGLAMARADVRVPVALPTLERAAPDFWSQLAQAAHDHEIKQIVVGLPRGLDGQETAQTKAVRTFAQELQAHIDLPISWQDEALTSVKAEELLDSRGQAYQRSEVDSLAATFILSDYLGAGKITS